MAPRVVPDFMAMLRDFCSAVGMLLRKSSSDEESAVYMRDLENGDQIIEALRVGAPSKSKHDFGFSARDREWSSPNGAVVQHPRVRVILPGAILVI